MKIFEMLLKKEAFLGRVLLALCLGALGAAFVAEYAFDLKPCALCQYQRVCYAVTAAVLILQWRIGKTQWWLPILAAVAVLFIFNAGIALYQVLVELHWVPAPASCAKATLSAGEGFDAFRQGLMTQPVVPCDQVAWSFLGISMAGYNALFCLSVGGGLGAWTYFLYRQKDSHA